MRAHRDDIINIKAGNRQRPYLHPAGKSLFQNIQEESFIIRAAHTLEEAVKLGEVGFEPFVVMDSVQLFRKRK